MSIFTIFQKPPPPKPIYKKQPIACTAVLLTVIGMFVLGPVGLLWNGMAEELEKKANNETVILYMKQQKETDDRQWEALEQQIQIPKSMILSPPNSLSIEKPVLTVEQFEKYMSMLPEIRDKYKMYLESRGYDVAGLPN